MKYLSRAIFVVLLAACFSGCYSGYKLTKKPIEADSIHKSFNQVSKLPVYISSISVKNKNISSGFENRVVAKLTETGLYRDVIYGIYSRRPNDTTYIDVRLDISEMIDQHTGGNALKGFFVGATLFLLTPVLPLSYDMEGEYLLRVIWPNGQQREYKAVCAVDAYGTLYQLNQAANDGSGEATDKCLNSVINQMGADYIKMHDSQHSLSESSKN
jgi:hypothetical protein